MHLIVAVKIHRSTKLPVDIYAYGAPGYGGTLFRLQLRIGEEHAKPASISSPMHHD